jgi:hypothetical protein
MQPEQDKPNKFVEEAQRICPPLSQTAIQIVRQSLSHKVYINAKDLTAKSRPEFGKTKGSLIATHDTDHHLFIVKPESMDSYQEFIAAILFKRALFNAAPLINLTTEGKLTSRFVEPLASRTFRELCDLVLKTRITKQDAYKTISEHTGLEKIIATMIRFGDLDFNDENIIFTEVEGSKFFSKVDHGWALTTFFTLESEMRKLFFSRAKQLLAFINLEKLVNAIEEVCNIPDDEIERLISIQTERLKNHKSNKPLKFLIGIDQQVIDNYPDITYQKVRFKDWDDYREYICERLRVQRITMLEMCKRLRMHRVRIATYSTTWYQI